MNTPTGTARSFFLSLLCAVLLLPLVGCGDGGGAPRDKSGVHFVATIQPLFLIVGELVEGRATVSRLLDPGASPHTYEPRPSDIRMATTADALVMVHSSLDGWAARLPGALRIEVFPLVPDGLRLHYEEGGHICSADHHHQHHSMDDAHFWTDPVVVAAVLRPLAEKLGEVDPEGRDHYLARAAAMESALLGLHDELAILLEPVVGASCVLFHPSFNYLFHRHGIRIAAVVEPSPGQEASPAWLKGVLDSIRETNAKVIFTEPQLSSRPAQVVAEASGVALREIDPIGIRGNPKTIADFLRYNAGILREALE